jgi:thiamine-phosphate pyrophosphorylase
MAWPFGARVVGISDRRAMMPGFGEAITRAGVGVVQVREKDLDGAAVLALARAAVATGVAVVVNDRLDVALVAGARGVHLPERGLPITEARALAPPGFVIGCSRHQADAARAALDAGADYVQLGPVFDTPGKGPAIGVAALAQACAHGGAIVAVGGIDDARRARACAEAGAVAVAAIRAVWRPGFDAAMLAAAWR